MNDQRTLDDIKQRLANLYSGLSALVAAGKEDDAMEVLRAIEKVQAELSAATSA